MLNWNGVIGFSYFVVRLKIVSLLVSLRTLTNNRVSIFSLLFRCLVITTTFKWIQDSKLIAIQQAFRDDLSEPQTKYQTKMFILRKDLSLAVLNEGEREREKELKPLNAVHRFFFGFSFCLLIFLNLLRCEGQRKQAFIFLFLTEDDDYFVSAIFSKWMNTYNDKYVQISWEWRNQVRKRIETVQCVGYLEGIENRYTKNKAKRKKWVIIRELVRRWRNSDINI